MRTNDKVVLCWDGKLCRNVEGIVTGRRKGHHVKVKFTPKYQEENPVEIEAWFRVDPCPWRHKKVHGWAKDIPSGDAFGYYTVVRECNYFYRKSKYPERHPA